MIVWGGYTKFQLLNTGGRYDPLANSWTADHHHERADRAILSHRSLERQ